MEWDIHAGSWPTGAAVGIIATMVGIIPAAVCIIPVAPRNIASPGWDIHAGSGTLPFAV